MKKLLIILTALIPVIGSGEITNVFTEDAPKPAATYSQATIAGQYMFLSGQVGINPATGQLAGSTVEEQTRQVIHNIKTILAANNLKLEDVVRCEVFLTDLNDFKGMNMVYGEEFTQPIKPARSTFQISKLPFNAIVKIECTAYIPN